VEVACAWVWPVRFDDRLRTVLDSPADDARDRAVRWRQLVELLARDPGTAPAELLDEALEEIRTGAASVEEQVRMATARAIAQLPLPLKLISVFAADRMSVAAPILASARLTAFEWGEVLAQASSECRRFIQALRSDPENGHTPPPPARELDVQHQPIPSISEVVARIERLRQSREPVLQTEHNEDQRNEAASVARLFRWETDENGQIAWVEGVPRGPLIGRSIAHSGDEGAVDRQIERAFAAKIPFHDARLELTEGTAIEGVWMFSGRPEFDAATGRFSGYRGVAERNAGLPETEAAAESDPADPDSLRDLAHEIRTPLNAIIGFSEIISGQYLGPAHHSYRERAAEIAAEARLLLTAIEDLDFAAKLNSAPEDRKTEIHLGALAERVIPSLRELAGERQVGIEASRSTRDLTAAVNPELAERLVLRMCTAVIERATPGESLRLSVDNGNGDCRISISRPKAMLGLEEAELFGLADKMPRDSFILRLTRGLAHIAGARLAASESELSLVFRKAPLGGDRHGVYF